MQTRSIIVTVTSKTYSNHDFAHYFLSSSDASIESHQAALAAQQRQQQQMQRAPPPPTDDEDGLGTLYQSIIRIHRFQDTIWPSIFNKIGPRCSTTYFVAYYYYVPYGILASNTGDDGAPPSDAADGVEGGSAAGADADGAAENAGDRPASAPKALTAAQVCPCVSMHENDIETMVQEYIDLICAS